MSQSSLPPQLRQLPVSERIDLVERIWDSIVEDQSQFELTDAQKAELDRRLAADKESPDRGRSFNDVKRGLAGDKWRFKSSSIQNLKTISPAHITAY